MFSGELRKHEYGYDHLENVDTLYDLLINLINENETLLDSSNEQIRLAQIIGLPEYNVSKRIGKTINKSEEQKTEILAVQSNILNKLKDLVTKKMT